MTSLPMSLQVTQVPLHVHTPQASHRMLKPTPQGAPLLRSHRRSPTQLTEEETQIKARSTLGASHISLGTAAGPGMVGNGGAGRQRTVSAGWGREASGEG